MAKGNDDSKKYRNFPKNSLEETLTLPQKIADEMAGKPFKRLLLSDAIGIKPSSTNFKYLLSSSYQYGLTEGTEKASEISLTPIGSDATQNKDSEKRMNAIRKAALTPEIFSKFFKDYQDKKLPSREMMDKILTSEYDVPSHLANECSELIISNGKFIGFIRDIGGSPHVLFDSSIPEPKPIIPEPDADSDVEEDEKEIRDDKITNMEEKNINANEDKKSKPIFIGHGKNKRPLEKLEKFLTSFQIPYKVTIDEANLGRPIPQKVRETMQQCGSAILIFTKDEKFYDDKNEEIWRPSENVVHELGASSFAYGDRIVIFKEKGIHFPINFQSIGYIEFEIDSIESKTADLLKELIGFGLVKVTPA